MGDPFHFLRPYHQLGHSDGWVLSLCRIDRESIWSQQMVGARPYRDAGSDVHPLELCSSVVLCPLEDSSCAYLCRCATGRGRMAQSIVFLWRLGDLLGPRLGNVHLFRRQSLHFELHQYNCQHVVC